ncbi:unnamed protein product [Absidia cylindrospora]
MSTIEDLSAQNSHSHCGNSYKLQWQHGIANQLSDLLNNDIDPDQLCDNMTTSKNSKHGQFALPLHRIQRLFKSEPWCSMNPVELAEWIVTKLSPSDYVEKASAIGTFVNFTIPKATFTESILQQIVSEGTQYGFYSDNSETDSSMIVISCDLPMLPLFLDPGHYRGLVLATFLQRSYRNQGQKVRLINTLTTWNADFGYLALAVLKYGLHPSSGQDLLMYLNQIYIQVRRDALNDDAIEEAAQNHLLGLEKGDSEMTSLWQQLQNTMIKEYQQLFDQRLFIDFDLHICATPGDDLDITYDLLEQCDGLVKEEDGNWRMDLESVGLGRPLVRNSNGISTQLTRDIAQLIKQERNMENQDFVEYHIAGHHLTSHLQQLYHIIAEINLLSSGQQRCLRRTHVDFGKVQLEATRKTKAPGFQLLDCLNSLQQTMLDIMEENEGTEKYDAMMAQLGQLSVTTQNKMMSDRPTEEQQQGGDERPGMSIDDLAKQHADKLGVCTMMAHQLAQRRSKPMIFSSSSPPDVFGNSGVFLQYVHSRLCGIERQLFKRGLLLSGNNTYVLPTKSTLGMGKLLYQQEAFDVVDVVTEFPRMMQQSQLTKDPSTLVTYLFKLARTANQSLYRLRIKDTQKELALARWTLFWAAKQTLANGLTALGIDPVYRI